MKVFVLCDAYVIAESEEEAIEIHDEAERKAVGRYQKALLRGEHNWSGSSLKGGAKNYASRYASSRENLLTRIDGVTVIDKTQNGRRVLILGGTSEEVSWLTSCLTLNIPYDDEKWYRQYVGARECGVVGAAEVIREHALREQVELDRIHAVSE